MRLVYYSLANAPQSGLEELWIQSIRSLRAHNKTIAVWLFLFNGASPELLCECERSNVRVLDHGSYPDFLQALHPQGSVLALYPTFHKFLQLANAVTADFEQVLFLDCDTFFFDDVDRLFDRYSAQHWYAREEPYSRRSYFEYDPSHIDEDVLAQVARSEKLRSVLPFNSGVCLLNHQIWREWERLRVPYLDLAWRLLCGRELTDHGAPLQHDQEVRRAVLTTITDSDRAHALDYPSQNTWIIEQISLWLALGHLKDFSLGTFSASDVAQGSEFYHMLESDERCVVAHYYSAKEDFFEVVPRIGPDLSL